MIINYKKRKLLIILPSEIYEEIRQTALGTNWTEEELLVWALEIGVDEIDNVDRIKKNTSVLIERKNKLDSDLESVTKDYIKLSGRNAALRYECYEAFSENKTRALKLTGARAKNRSLKNVLKITDEVHNEQEERADNEMVEKYVLNRVSED